MANDEDDGRVDWGAPGSPGGIEDTAEGSIVAYREKIAKQHEKALNATFRRNFAGLMFGAMVVTTLVIILVGAWLIGNAKDAADAKLIIEGAFLPLLGGAGTFVSTVFAAFLGFALGYFYRTGGG